jgi:hypothetical protein
MNSDAPYSKKVFFLKFNAKKGAKLSLPQFLKVGRALSPMKWY